MYIMTILNLVKYTNLNIINKKMCNTSLTNQQLILDEPFNGLDKDGVKEMREYLLSYKEQGKTILICSHSAEDISVLCDTVHEMDKGVIEGVR